MSRPTLLIVDDHAVNITVLREVLKVDYRVLAAKDGATALEVARRLSPDLILLDVMMPGWSGYRTCAELKAEPRTRKIPVIFVTSQDTTDDEEEGFRQGAVDYILKPVRPAVVRARVKTHLALSDQNRALEAQVAERTRQILETQREVVKRLSIASEYKDAETGHHIHRIGAYSEVLAAELGVPSDELDEYRNAASLHDLGKIGIPDAILLKKGPLESDEWEIMKTHTLIGARMLEDLPQPLFRLSTASALTHHERWDGKGYPRGLSGTEIPLIGRIVAVVDVFDALLSDRPYKKAWPLDQALDHLRQGSGSHFDPAVIDAFFRRLDDLVTISRQR